VERNMTNKPQPPSAFFNVSMSPEGIRLERDGASIVMTAQEWDYVVLYAKWHGWASNVGLFLDGAARKDGSRSL
jgi:hypothetical protein